MTTIDQVRKYLTENKWTELEELFDGRTHVYKSQWNLPNDRTQVVWAQLNSQFYQLMSPFAIEGDLSAERALNMNETLFGVGKYLGHYCLVSLGVVSSFSSEGFELLEQLTAKFADDLEKNSGGGDVL